MEYINSYFYLFILFFYQQKKKKKNSIVEKYLLSKTIISNKSSLIANAFISVYFHWDMSNWISIIFAKLLFSLIKKSLCYLLHKAEFVAVFYVMYIIFIHCQKNSSLRTKLFIIKKKIIIISLLLENTNFPLILH